MARNNAIITITKIILTRQGSFWPTMGYIRPSDAALGYSSALRLRAGYIADRKQTQPYSIPFWPILALFGLFWPTNAHTNPGKDT
jgi:hypothetical protein